MRISDYSRHEHSLRSLQSALGRLVDTEQKIASGKRISKPSDAPMDVALATQLRAERDANERHLRTLGDARAWLAVQDNALQSASALLARVEQLATLAINGAMGAESREAIAVEIDGLREHLGLLANTTYQGQAVFGAHGSSAVTLTPSSATFTGQTGATVERQVAPDQVIAVNTDGHVVFGFDAGAGQDVFSALNQLAADVRSGDAAAISTAAGVVKDRATTLRESLGEVGTRAALVESAVSRVEDDKLTFASRLTEIEDIDIAEASVELARASQTYEAVLAMTARTQQLSLLDFLR